MSNKKLSQLTEKLTSLNPEDLLYVSTNGVSKSIKASTLEAPLKTYADNKASDAQANAISAANSTAQSLVNAEAARATSAESSLQAQISTEITNRIDADSDLQDMISVEASRAVAAESLLQNQITAEVSDRQALSSRVDILEADPVTKTYVNQKTQQLQQQISSMLSNLDPAALDSFSEVVAAFQAADGSLSGAITALSSSLSASINEETLARQAADSSLESQIQAEQSRAVGVENSLQSQITQEISDRQADVSAEESRAISAEASLQSQITQEVLDRQSGDAALQAALEQEVLDRNAAIYTATTGHLIPRETLVYDLGSEEYRFRDLYLSGNTIILGETTISSNENGELNLQEGATVGGDLIASEVYVNSAVSVEESARILADQQLQANIDAEEARALAAESALNTRIDNILSNITPESLDSLTEIVTAFQEADGSLSGAITNLATTTSNNLNAEVAARQAAISTLQSQITSEESSRISGDSSTLSSAQSYTNSVAAALVPAGVISMYAGSVAPTGYLLCDGSAVSRSTYSSLFSVIGTSYGSGNGSTTFNLPNPDSNANIKLIIKF